MPKKSKISWNKRVTNDPFLSNTELQIKIIDHHYAEILLKLEKVENDENLIKELLIRLQHLLDVKIELTSSINDHFSMYYILYIIYTISKGEGLPYYI